MTNPLGEIEAILTGRIKQLVERKMRSAVLYGVALILLVTAFIAGVAAIWVILAERWGALAACLMIAAAAFLLAVILAYVIALNDRAQRRKERAAAEQMRATVAAAMAILPELSSKKSLLFATVIGLVVGLASGIGGPKDKT